MPEPRRGLGVTSTQVMIEGWVKGTFHRKQVADRKEGLDRGFALGADTSDERSRVWGTRKQRGVWHRVISTSSVPKGSAKPKPEKRSSVSMEPTSVTCPDI